MAAALFATAALCAVVGLSCYWKIAVQDVEWPHPHEWALLVTMSLCAVATPASLIGGILLCLF